MCKKECGKLKMVGQIESDDIFVFGLKVEANELIYNRVISFALPVPMGK